MRGIRDDEKLSSFRRNGMSKQGSVMLFCLLPERGAVVTLNVSSWLKKSELCVYGRYSLVTDGSFFP